MHTRVKAEIVALARATPAEEVCGFIYADEDGLKALPCRNVAADPANEFEIAQEDHLKALGLGRLFGVYHSHPDDSSFSPEDLEAAIEMGLPYYLYSADGQWREYVPSTYQPPIEQRPFVLGTWDCYGLIRDYWRQHGHYLTDYDRDESFCHEERNVIMDSFEREGFALAPIDALQPSDVLMFKTDRALPQHFGIFLGRQRMLHHPQGGLSGNELLNDRWLSRLCCAFRLKPAALSV